ncbi:hypothetical protein BC835DRAFT_1512682 [Cytidiella melzeri]|nr:hypothetical protein BC835DRAFT_1512682 [Cytidiella melzeri]
MLLPAQLPVEIVSTVITFLPLQSLHALRRLNHEWRFWFDANQSHIYQHAAFIHGFIPTTETLLEDAVNANKQLLTNAKIDNWRSFCQLRFSLEASWAGLGDISLTTLLMDHSDVHRLKIDEDIGIIITTHRDGGINVRDLGTDEVLWALPRTYVRRYAHCEYEKGFLIWDRDNQKEVWRLASQYEASPAPIDQLQQLVSFTINRYMPTSKGHFKPWAVIETPASGFAFRFVYPTLVVVGMDDAWLYDVLSCELVQVISDIQAVSGGQMLGAIRYVELSAQYVLICGSYQLRIFDRFSGALLHAISSSRVNMMKQGIILHGRQDLRNEGVAAVAPLVGGHAGHSAVDYSEDFAAVHVDTDGKSVVAMLSSSRLLVIRDIEELIQGEKEFEDLAMQVVFSCPEHEAKLRLPYRGVYLAVEHGRVGVITTFGIFILTLDATRHRLVDPDVFVQCDDRLSNLPFPYIQPCRLLPFSDWAPLNATSCLQMTQRKMIFSYSRYYVPRGTEGNARAVGREPEPEIVVGYNDEGEEVSIPTDRIATLIEQPNSVTMSNEDSMRELSSLQGLMNGAARTCYTRLSNEDMTRRRRQVVTD